MPNSAGKWKKAITISFTLQLIAIVLYLITKDWVWVAVEYVFLSCVVYCCIGWARAVIKDAHSTITSNNNSNSNVADSDA